MTNPYTPPQADVVEPLGPRPASINYVLVILGFSVVMFLLNSYFLSITEDGLRLDDPFNIAVNLIWVVIVIWLSRTLISARENPKYTMLILGLLLTVLALMDLDELWVAVTGFAEAACFFAGYLILNEKALQKWFRG